MPALIETAAPTTLKEGILVVEDDPGLRQMVGSTLTKLGYEVMEAEDANDAFKLASMNARNNLRLLITDIVMPDMDGRDLAHWMRGSYRGLKVLFISGFTHKRLADHLGPETGSSFLQKPFTQEELSQRVRSFLN